MTMSEAAKQARRNYLREWRKKNADKVKRQQISYWERKAAESKPETEESKRYE